MADLQATPAVTGLPVTLGGVSLSLIDPAPVTSVAPYPGADPDPALSALGLRFPAPGRVSAQGAVRLAWAGRGMAFLIGAPAPQGLDVQAALSDQSDGWVWVHLAGGGARDVLARLTPLDLRESGLPVGGAARSMLGHMQALILRPAPEAYDIAVFRSMAGTLVHEITEAMRSVCARANM